MYVLSLGRVSAILFWIFDMKYPLLLGSDHWDYKCNSLFWTGHWCHSSGADCGDDECKNDRDCDCDYFVVAIFRGKYFVSIDCR